MRQLEFFEMMICRKIMNLFEMIGNKHTWDDITFCKAWLKSEVLDRTISYDQTLFCQSVLYYYNDVMAEFGKDLKETGNEMYFPALGWFGYTTTYWMYRDNVKPEIFDNYDIKYILQDYPVLHTYSTKHAIDEIRENYFIKAKP